MRYLSLLSFLVLVGCASTAPQATPVDLNWEFQAPTAGQPNKACLTEDQVTKIREALDRCSK